MGVKRNGIGILMISLVFMLTTCSASQHKKSLVKYIGIENNEIIIKLDNTNRSKRFGDISNIELIQTIYLQNYECDNDEIIIREDISYLIEQLQENTEYKIVIRWFGGYLKVYTLYQNGIFEVLNEKYSEY